MGCKSKYTLPVGRPEWRPLVTGSFLCPTSWGPLFLWFCSNLLWLHNDWRCLPNMLILPKFWWCFQRNNSAISSQWQLSWESALEKLIHLLQKLLTPPKASAFSYDRRSACRLSWLHLFGMFPCVSSINTFSKWRHTVTLRGLKWWLRGARTDQCKMRICGTSW